MLKLFVDPQKMSKGVLGPSLCSISKWTGSTRAIATTSACLSDVSGKYKRTNDQSRPLTYEQYNKPAFIGRKKAWQTWHTSNLEGFEKGRTQRPVEDEIIRRLLRGIFFDLLVNEMIIKRRGNLIVVASFIYPRLPPRWIYWKIGFAEELLSRILKQPIRLELQTIADRDDVIFRYV